MGARANGVATRDGCAGSATPDISIMLATALRPSTAKTCADGVPNTTVARSISASIAACIGAYMQQKLAGVYAKLMPHSTKF